MRMKMLRNTVVEGKVIMAGSTTNVPEKHVFMLKHAGKAVPVGEGKKKKDKGPGPETASVEPGEQAVSQKDASRRSDDQDE